MVVPPPPSPDPPAGEEGQCQLLQIHRAAAGAEVENPSTEVPPDSTDKHTVGSFATTQFSPQLISV